MVGKERGGMGWDGVGCDSGCKCELRVGYYVY